MILKETLYFFANALILSQTQKVYIHNCDRFHRIGASIDRSILLMRSGIFRVNISNEAVSNSEE